MSSLYTQQAFGFGEDTLSTACLRRTGSDVTYVTCGCPLLAAALVVSRLTRTVRRRHVIAADPLATGTFRRGLLITAVRYGRCLKLGKSGDRTDHSDLGAASATDDPDATSHIGRYRFVLSRYGQGAALRTTPPARRGGLAL